MKEHVQISFNKIQEFKGGAHFPFGFHPFLQFSSDDTSLYTTAEDNTLKELDVQEGEVKSVFITSDNLRDNVVSFALSNDGQHIVTCSFEEPLKLWKKDSKKLIGEYFHNDFLIRKLIISGDNKYVIAGGEGGIVYIWDLITGQKKSEIHTQDVRSKAWNNYGYALNGLELNGLDKFEEATKKFQKAIEINPNNDMVWFEYSKSLYALGKIEESNEKLQNAIDINPNLGIEYKLGRS